jgi:hypothetical protein
MGHDTLSLISAASSCLSHQGMTRSMDKANMMQGPEDIHVRKRGINFRVGDNVRHLKCELQIFKTAVSGWLPTMDLSSTSF